MSTRVLSFDQEEWLLKCVNLIEKEYKKGTTVICQEEELWDQYWDLQKEMWFIDRVLSDREYSIHDDADKLNSLRNLYKNLKKRLSTSN